MSVVASTPAGPLAHLDDPGRLRAASRRENFPVALRLLPRRQRADLLAVYGAVRLVDDAGDAAAGDRSALLDEVEADLHRVWSGARPRLEAFRALVPTVRRCGLTAEPFLALVEANRRDQRISRYPTFDDLLGYCALSAAPVGRLVLAVFAVDTDPQMLAASDDVCAALQVLEHCQDVAEDLRDRDRVYLPAADLAAAGVVVADLGADVASPALRALVRTQVARAETLLAAGPALAGRLQGPARLAVAGYVAGGRATADAIRRVDGDVLAHRVRPRRRDVVRHLLTLLATSRPTVPTGVRP